MLKSERIYLNENLKQNIEKSGSMRKKGENLPYWEMLTSASLWSLIFCTFAANMIAVLIQVYVPIFFKEVLFLSMLNNGVFSAIPNISQFVVKMGWSVVMDILKEKKLSINAACKISQGFCEFIQSDHFKIK
jgi:hypothetical protein